MKHLSALLSSYARGTLPGRRLILAQLLDYEPDMESEEVRALLWREAVHGEPALLAHVRHTLGSFLRKYSAQAFGLAASPAPSHPADETRDRVRAAGHLFLEGLRRLTPGDAGRSSGLRLVGSLVAGCLWTPESIRSLRAGVDGGAGEAWEAFSLAELGFSRDDEAILGYVRKWSPERPELLLLLHDLPSPESVALVSDLMGRFPVEGLINAALALGNHPFEAARDVFRRLIDRHEQDVLPAVLVALRGMEDPEAWEILRDLYHDMLPPELKAMVVQAVGNLSIPPAGDLLLEAMQTDHAIIAAAALEATLARRLPPVQAVVHARRWLESPDPTVRSFAVLVVAQVEPERVVPVIRELLSSNTARDRFEGAQLLGQARSRTGCALLERMAWEDPSPVVRSESVLSLGQYDVDLRWPVLIPLVSGGDPDTAVRAAQVLAGGPPQLARALTDIMESAIPRRKSPEERARFLPILGTCAARAGGDPPDLLVESIEAHDVVLHLGALKGIRLLGDRIPGELVDRSRHHADPRVRARAELALFLAGHLSGLTRLADMVARGEDLPIQEALLAVLEAGLLVSRPGGLPGFETLQRALADHGQTPAFQQMIREAESPQATRPGRRATRMALRPLTDMSPLLNSSTAIPLVDPREPGSRFRVARTGPQVPASGETAVPGGESPGALVERTTGPGSGRSSLRSPHDEHPIGSTWSLLVRDFVREVVRSRGILPSFAIIGLVVVGWRFTGCGEEPSIAEPRSGTSCGLTVQELKGGCFRSRAGTGPTRLHAGDRVLVGDRLRADPGSRLRLLDRDSGWVELGPESELTVIARVPFPDGHEPPGQAFGQLAGTLELALEPLAAIGLDVGGHRIRGVRARMKWEVGAQGPVLTVLVGDATIFKDGERLKSLGEGDSWTLPGYP